MSTSFAQTAVNPGQSSTTVTIKNGCHINFWPGIKNSSTIKFPILVVGFADAGSGLLTFYITDQVTGVNKNSKQVDLGPGFFTTTATYVVSICDNNVSVYKDSTLLGSYDPPSQYPISGLTYVDGEVNGFGAGYTVTFVSVSSEAIQGDCSGTSSSDSSDTSSSAPAKKSSMMLIIIIVAVVVVLAAAGGGFAWWYFSRKRLQNGQPRQPKPPRQPRKQQQQMQYQQQQNFDYGTQESFTQPSFEQPSFQQPPPQPEYNPPVYNPPPQPYYQEPYPPYQGQYMQPF